MKQEPTVPYIYQPFGIQDKSHWEAKRIFAIAGISGLVTIKGLTRDEAEKILTCFQPNTGREVGVEEIIKFLEGFLFAGGEIRPLCDDPECCLCEYCKNTLATRLTERFEIRRKA